MGVTWHLSFHPGVWDDAGEALVYYASVEPELPGRFLTELQSVFRFVGQYPNAGAQLHRTFRRVALRRFPYLVCYRVADGTVRIVAIVHARRDPSAVRRDLEQRA